MQYEDCETRRRSFFNPNTRLPKKFVQDCHLCDYNISRAAYYGFYCTKNRGTGREFIRCFSCRLEVYDIRDTHIPEVVHILYGSWCKFLNELLNKKFLSINSPITNMLHCTDYAEEENRLNSLYNWSFHKSFDIGEFARAGFYSVGKYILRCFSCNYQIMDRPLIILPWSNHMPGCRHVRRFRTCIKPPVAADSFGNGSVPNKCLICSENRANVLLLPCLHLVICSDCMPKSKRENYIGKCLKCNVKILEFKRIFFA